MSCRLKNRSVLCAEPSDDYDPMLVHTQHLLSWVTGWFTEFTEFFASGSIIHTLYIALRTGFFSLWKCLAIQRTEKCGGIEYPSKFLCECVNIIFDELSRRSICLYVFGSLKQFSSCLYIIAAINSQSITSLSAYSTKTQLFMFHLKLWLFWHWRLLPQYLCQWFPHEQAVAIV